MFAEKLGQKHHSLLTWNVKKKQRKNSEIAWRCKICVCVKHDFLGLFDRLSKGPLGVKSSKGMGSGKLRDESFIGTRRTKIKILQIKKAKTNSREQQEILQTWKILFIWYTKTLIFYCIAIIPPANSINITNFLTPLRNSDIVNSGNNRTLPSVQ